MKNIVTAFLVAAALGLGANAQAQVSSETNTNGMVATSPTLAPATQGPWIYTPAAAPLFTPTEELFYYDEATETPYLWKMPTDVQVRGEGLIDTIVGYGVRFTSAIPGAGSKRFLDSLKITYRAFAMDPGQRILFVVRRQQLNQNGIPFFEWGSRLDTVSIGIDDIVINDDETDNTLYDVTIKFHHKPVQTNFLVFAHLWEQTLMKSTPEVTNTDIRFLSDAMFDTRDLDPEIDRSYKYSRNLEFPETDSSISTYVYQSYMARSYINPETQEVIYPNFFWKAYVSGVADVAQTDATTFSVQQNYPNPFVSSTEINYSVKETTPVSIKVFNAMGVEVANLVNEVKAAGPYSVTFDASNLASGNYIYTMTAGGETITKAMTLSK